MNWQRWLVALFVAVALAGCAQGSVGQTRAQYAPYSPATNQNAPEHGGGDGGGGGGSSWRAAIFSRTILAPVLAA